MSSIRPDRGALLLALVLLLVSGCARERPEKRVLVFQGSSSSLPEAEEALQELAAEEGIVLDAITDPAVFVEDSLARYSAVLLLNTAGDSLDHRQQADLERYVQAGGGVVAVGALPARTWPWFNEMIGAAGEPGTPVRAARDAGAPVRHQPFNGGRVALTNGVARPEHFADSAFVDALRDGLRFAIGKNRWPDYDRARTLRVPDAGRFHQEILVPGPLEEPTELAVTRDGRVFFTERKGALKLYDPSTRETRVAALLDVNYEEENGLIGLALDPRFDETGWLYLNYSVADTLKHRVSRFTFTGDTLADEHVLLEVPFTEGCCHTGGSMTFDAHGNLFVSFGDNTNPFDAGPYAPIDPTPGRELMDARRSSANTQDLRGKILRITPQPDGSYTVPDGNLFEDPAEGRPEIYTMGHRNPYRISVDRHTGFLYWGEVGPDARVDSLLGPRGYDEVNQARGPGNFGWPLFIADNKPYRNFNFTSGWIGELFDPQRPVNDSPNNTGATVLPPAQPAFIYYPYNPSEEFPLVGEGGRNAMAGPVYYYDDYPGSSVRLPRYYDGKLIIYDWMRGWMMAVTMDEEGDFVKMEPFLDHLSFDHPIDVELGPEGSLYVLEYGTYWFASNQTAQLSRITFHEGNRPPTARVTADRTTGAAPLAVTFSADGSSDEDEGDALRYLWVFGDGTTAEGPTTTHTFAEPGAYEARLTVRDAAGATDEATVEIQVGNEPSAVRIAVDGNRSFYWADGPLNYQVEVSDAEDGRLEDGIDPQRVRVTFDYVPGFDRTLSAQGHQVNRTPRGLALIEGSDCMACHGVDQASVGPSFRMVAERYAGEDDAVPYLIERIIEGGGGVWGEHSMAAHPNLSRDEAEEMVRYILALGDDTGTLATAGTLYFDRHRPGEEGIYILTASYTDEVRNGVGPLTTRAELVLQPPVLRAAGAADNRFFGMREGPAAGGTERVLATAYAGDAYLHLPETDLTGIGRIRFDVQALRHDFTLELRSGGPDGELLASKHVQVPPPNTWFELTLPVDAEGMHDLYVVLRSDAEGLGQWNPLVRLDTIRFERKSGS